MVGGVGGSLVEVFLVHALQAHRFARQCRFVHVQRCCFHQFAVSRNLLAGIENDDIADNNVLAWNLRSVAITNYFHRLVVVHLIKNGELLVSLQFKIEGKSRCEKDGYEYAYGFKEYGSSLSESEVFIT